jgi:putative oxidoreductase
MSMFLQVIRDLGLLLARLGLGGILMLHGWTRWQGPGQGIQRQADLLTQAGVPSARIVTWSMTFLEMVGGLFLVVGFLTPLVALLMLVEQALIISYLNWYKGPDLLNADGTYAGGYEYNVALGLLALILLVFGAGRIAIDRLFRRKKTEPAEDEETAPTSPNVVADYPRSQPQP